MTQIYQQGKGSGFRCPARLGSSAISRMQHWKLLKISQSLCHIVIYLPRDWKCLTRKWRYVRDCLASKCSEPAPPRFRCGLELPPKISSFRGIPHSWEAYGSRLEPHRVDEKVWASSNCLFGYSAFLKNRALDLSETFVSQRKHYDLATTGRKVLNSQMAITSSSYKDGLKLKVMGI